METGKLRHRVQIQEATETRDAQGGVTWTWATIASRWAKVEPIRGKEYFEAHRTDATVTHRVTMRHYVNLTNSHRIVHDSRNLNIESILNTDEIDMVQVVMCREDV